MGESAGTRPAVRNFVASKKEGKERTGGKKRQQGETRKERRREECRGRLVSGE
jgi:hypothetical protein